MGSKPRRRNPTNADQSNGKEKGDQKNKKSSARKSSNKTLAFLVVMVIVTWGVAATAYFGVINYKAIFGLENPVKVEARSPESAQEPLNAKEEAKTKKDSVPDNKAKEKRTEEASKVNKKSIVLEREADISAKAKEIAEEIKAKYMKKAKTVAEKAKESAEKKADSVKEPSQTAKKTKKASSTATKKGAKINQFTSIKDKPILKELEEGEQLLKRKRGKDGVLFFQKLIDSNPQSAMAVYGKARALLIQAEQERNNQLLRESITTFGQVGEHPFCPDSLKKEALLTKVDKLHFLGQVKEALQTARALYNEFNRDVKVINKLGVCYLWIGKNDKAATLYEIALQIDPKDGFALVHYGFIVKIKGDWVKGARYLQQGVDSGEEGTQEGKFYLHLGDALYRTNRSEEANQIYQRGADKGMFLSKYQRSLYNVDRLKSHPFWTAEEAKASQYVKKLEKNWKMIRDEALSIMDTDKGLFLPEEESLKNTGDWKQLTLYQRGKPQKDCGRLPKTCALVGKMPNAFGCTRGQIKFSIMQPGTHVWAHTGPTNCRLRMHLGLVIPKTGEGAKIRCAEEFRTWEEGKVLIFDDSFEHEVWQYAESYRLILIIDVWHPDITEQEKRTLSPI